jgi:hypothetical protein
VHVEFEAVDAEVERVRKSRKRVLGPKAGATTMRDVQGFAHDGKSLPPSLANFDRRASEFRRPKCRKKRRQSMPCAANHAAAHKSCASHEFSSAVRAFNMR